MTSTLFLVASILAVVCAVVVVAHRSSPRAAMALGGCFWLQALQAALLGSPIVAGVHLLLLGGLLTGTLLVAAGGRNPEGEDPIPPPAGPSRRIDSRVVVAFGASLALLAAAVPLWLRATTQRSSDSLAGIPIPGPDGGAPRAIGASLLTTHAPTVALVVALMLTGGLCVAVLRAQGAEEPLREDSP